MSSLSYHNTPYFNKIGNTPLVKLKNIIPDSAANVFVKLEDLGMGNSIKARIAFQMIINAEKAGILTPGSGQVIIEPTGGNTGSGLAMVGAMRGYKVELVIPDSFSKEKIGILKAYGATVHLSDSSTGNDSHLRMAETIIKEKTDYVYLNQFENPSNPEAHYTYTATEILAELDRIDIFISGVGSGGTISGVGRKLKEALPNVKIYGLQPTGCDVLNGCAVKHKIEGIALGFIPKVFDSSIIDDMVSVDDDVAVDLMKRLAKEEGLFVGISASANIYGAIQLAMRSDKSYNIVTVAPDGGKNYLSMFA